MDSAPVLIVMMNHLMLRIQLASGIKSRKMRTHEGVKFRIIRRKPTSCLSVEHCIWGSGACCASLLTAGPAEVLLLPASRSFSTSVEFVSVKYLGSSTWKWEWQLLLPGHGKSDIFNVAEDRYVPMMMSLVEWRKSS